PAGTLGGTGNPAEDSFTKGPERGNLGRVGWVRAGAGGHRRGLLAAAEEARDLEVVRIDRRAADRLDDRLANAAVFDPDGGGFTTAIVGPVVGDGPALLFE